MCDMLIVLQPNFRQPLTNFSHDILVLGTPANISLMVAGAQPAARDTSVGVAGMDSRALSASTTTYFDLAFLEAIFYLSTVRSDNMERLSNKSNAKVYKKSKKTVKVYTFY